MLDDADRRRRQDARRARDARYRRRRDASRIVVQIEVDEELLGLILRLHWLKERDAADREKIGRAIAVMLAASART